MPITEHGEIGRLVQYKPELEMVVLWAVYEVHGLNFRTSRGWIKETNLDAYFAPRPWERSLRPCIQRAIDYAKKNWPGVPAQTH